jgi:diguanylate cyclase (GGDEF)-like protein
MGYFLTAVISAFILTIPQLFASEHDILLKTNIANTEDSALVFTEQEQAWMKENKSISVIGDISWFPFEGFDINGHYSGIVAEVLSLIGEKSGLIFNVSKTASWSDTLKYSLDQQVDVISGSASNPLLEKNYRSTYSTIKNPIVIVGPSSMGYIPDLTVIKDLRIALVNRSGYSNTIAASYPRLSFIGVAHISDALLGVADGEYDVAITSMALASYQIPELGLYELRIVGVTDLDMELTLFVNRNKPILWDIINKVKLHETPLERHEILSKWIKQKYIDRYPPERMRTLMLIISILIGFTFYRNRLLKKQEKELLQLSQTDKLTNIHNRLYLDKVLLQSISQSKRYKTTFSLIIIDIDLFKQVNDKFGHIIGDKLLKQFSFLLSDNIRSSDVVGRWGGEEFLIVCPETNLQEALILAEKLREIIYQAIFINVGKKTASFGVAEFRSDDRLDDCLGRADKALYRAKDSGRNQVKAEG